ncbi:MAG TPA: TonB-dependent receptor [Novosphingobium sp.]|nr:TonB-dependent receptor [Novosphingobium sp.]
MTAGAVVMRSRRPTGDFGGSVRLGLGSGGRKMVGFGIEGPLGETVAAKIYTQYSDRSGDWDLICSKLDPALTLGCPGLNGRKHFGREETLFMRPIVRFRPSSAVDITFIGEYGTLKGDGTPSRVLNDPLSPTTFNSPVGREPRGGAEKLSINYVGYTDIVWYQGALEATWDVGPGIITSITGFRDVDYESAGESDGTPLDISRGGNAMKQHQFSQELRFAGQAFDGRFDYTVGAYYFEQSVNQLYSIRFFGPSNQRSQGKLDHKSWSVFAQGDFEFAPGAFLTLGGRYNWEKKPPLIARTVDCTLPPVQNQALFPFTCNLQPLTPAFKTWSNFTPKVGLTWKANPDVLVYASWTKGFRSGGYNIRTTGTVATESPGPYDPEVVKALELGVKADLFNRRARINAAIFQNRFTGLQRTVNEGPRNFITNAANATVEGAELEVTLLPVDTLALTANVGYLDARYKNYLLPLSNGTVLDLSGKQMIRAPKWSYTLAATHDLSLGSAGDLSSRVSYSHNGKTPMNDAGAYFTPGFNLLDASLSWSPAGRRDIKLSLWGKNLTNETYAVTGTVVRPVFTILYQSLPRHFGAEFSYKF